MGWRQPGLGELLHHPQRRQHRTRRLPEMDQDPVAQPLHRHAAMLARGPVDQHGQGRGQLGGGRVAALLGQPRVAHQVHEGHRGDPLRPPQHAGPFELVLDVLDHVLGPYQLLLPAVDGRERAIDQRQEVRRHLRGELHSGPLFGARVQHRPREPGPVGLVLDVGGQPQALRIGPADPRQPDRIQDPRKARQSQQRHNLQLVLPDRLVGRHPGEPHRLQDAGEGVQRHAALLADLPVGPRRAQRPPAVRRALQERERQSSCPDRRRDRSMGSRACSQAAARRTFCTSVSRNARRHRGPPAGRGRPSAGPRPPSRRRGRRAPPPRAHACRRRHPSIGWPMPRRLPSLSLNHAARSPTPPRLG